MVILVGALRVDVDIEQKQVVVEFDEKLANLEVLIDKLIDKIEEIGFKVRM